MGRAEADPGGYAGRADGRPRLGGPRHRRADAAGDGRLGPSGHRHRRGRRERLRPGRSRQERRDVGAVVGRRRPNPGGHGLAGRVVPQPILLALVLFAGTGRKRLLRVEVVLHEHRRRAAQGQLPARVRRDRLRSGLRPAARRTSARRAARPTARAQGRHQEGRNQEGRRQEGRTQEGRTPRRATSRRATESRRLPTSPATLRFRSDPGARPNTSVSSSSERVASRVEADARPSTSPGARWLGRCPRASNCEGAGRGRRLRNGLGAPHRNRAGRRDARRARRERAGAEDRAMRSRT